MNKLLKLALLFVIFTMIPSIQMLDAQASSDLKLPLTKLKDVVIQGRALNYGTYVNIDQGSDDLNISYGQKASTKPYEMFTNSKGNICIFSKNTGTKPTVYTLDSNYNVASKLQLNIPWYDKFGKFKLGSDGNYYVVVGYKNISEDPNKVTVKVHKVSPTTGEVIKTADIYGKNDGSQFLSIQEPFVGGTADFVIMGDTLYLNMSYCMFKASDGHNHQASNMFAININEMKLTWFPSGFYVSHSFNQILTSESSDLIGIAHGDAYPRSMRLIVRDSSGNVKECDFLPMQGSIGNNDTGSMVNGIEFGQNNYLVVGNSITHNKPVNGVLGTSDWNLGRNIYLSVINKNSMSPKHIWITQFNPKNKDILVGEPVISKVGDNKFAIVYSVQQRDDCYMEYKLVDEDGNVIYEKQFKDQYFIARSPLFTKDNNLLWLSPYVANTPKVILNGAAYWNPPEFTKNGKVFLFDLNLKIPENPNLIEGVRPEKIVLGQSDVTLQSGHAMKPTWKVLPENTPFDDAIVSVEAGMKAFAKNDGWVVAIEQDSNTEVVVRSEYLFNVNSSFNMNITSRPKPTKADIPQNSMITDEKKEGVFTKYDYFVMEVGGTYGGPYPVTYENRDLVVNTKVADESIAKIGRGGALTALKVGKSEVIYTVDGEKITVPIEVIPKLPEEGFTINTLPTKTDYTVGEPFDPSGFEGFFRQKNVNEYSVVQDKAPIYVITDLQTTPIRETWGIGRPLTKAGKTKVRAVYGGSIAEFTINVTNPNHDSTETDDEESEDVSGGGIALGDSVMDGGNSSIMPQTVTAIPSSTKIQVNGKVVKVDAYSINDNNYIKLRDLATMINGTDKNFNVGWDESKNAINLTSKQSYIPVGGEMSTGDGNTRDATLSTSSIYVDGNEAKLTAYVIGDNNYFKLRDVMDMFDVYVGYNNANSTAFIDTQQKYESTAVLQNGTYAIKAKKNPKFVFDVFEASKKENAKVIIYTESDAVNQQFKITNVSGDKYTIIAAHSGMALTSGGEKGQQLFQSSLKNNENQIFTILIEDGDYKIKDYKGFYIGIFGAKMANETGVGLWTKADGGSQEFVFTAK